MSRDRYQPKTPPAGIAAQLATPEPVWDDITGKYEGVDLRAARGKRSTDERIARLEDKHDDLAKGLGALGITVGKMDGKLDTFLDFIKADREAARAAHAEEQRTERTQITSRAKVAIAIVGAIGTAIGVIVTQLAGCV